MKLEGGKNSKGEVKASELSSFHSLKTPGMMFTVASFFYSSQSDAENEGKPAKQNSEK